MHMNAFHNDNNTLQYNINDIFDSNAKIMIPENWNFRQDATSFNEHPEIGHFNELMGHVKRSFEFRRQSETVEFDSIFLAFKLYILNGHNPQLFESIINNYDGVQLEKNLLPVFKDYVQKVYPEDHRLFLEQKHFADLTNPRKLYPNARRIRRKIIYHAGPTNSGKTYGALQRLKSAEYGLYCAPLRLLANAIYYDLNAEGIKCNLKTGQEIKEVPFAKHISSTVEMTEIDTIYDVAVIDEIQMIGDTQRGHAWTRALLGIVAPEIHVCGDASAIDLVTKICETVGEEVEVRHYERFNELKVLPYSLEGNVHNIQDRDCIVSFRRDDIFAIKQFIERNTNKKCCVIYGSLPPDTRREQADIYNDPKSGYTVMCASDAIGLGLNLNIKRVVFYTLDKYNHDTKRVGEISVSLAKQIAGRAGRRGFYPNGEVTTFFKEDHARLQQLLKQEVPPTTKAGIFPTLANIEEFVERLKLHHLPFSQILKKYFTMMQISPLYFISEFDTFINLAAKLDHLDLTLAERFTFIQAPFENSPMGHYWFNRFAEEFASGKVVKIDDLMLPRSSASQSHSAMKNIERKTKAIEAYIWLSNRFPLRFDGEAAMKKFETVLGHIERSLKVQTQRNKKFEELDNQTIINELERILLTENIPLKKENGIHITNLPKKEKNANKKNHPYLDEILNVLKDGPKDSKKSTNDDSFQKFLESL